MPNATHAQPDARHDRFYSTAELALNAGVTARTVRFYETRGLLKPQRAGTMRVFTYADRARLMLILRGKRVGFSLNDIGDYLDFYGADAEHIEQLDHVIDKSRARIAELEDKLKDLQAIIKELRQIEHEAIVRLKTKRTHASTPRKFTTISRPTHPGRPKP
jgi:DNA-binding transcriptional MerR regulator